MSAKLVILLLVLLAGGSQSRQLNKYEMASIRYLEDVLSEGRYVRVPCDPAMDGGVCCKCTETGDCYLKCPRRR